MRIEGESDSVSRVGMLLKAAVGTGLRRIGAGLALLSAIVAGTAAAPLAESAEKATTVADISRGPLDGMVFVGKIGLEGKLDLDDELHFSKGQFWSSNCVACGYQSGAYWTRTVGDQIHFRGVLESGDRGELDYSGRIVDDRVEVSIRWTQRRWYWSIDRKLEFVGTLATGSMATEPGSKDVSQCKSL